MENFFRDKTRGSKEVIFSVAHSSDLELDENGKPTTQAIGSFIARSAGGTHNAQPSLGTSCCLRNDEWQDD